MNQLINNTLWAGPIGIAYICMYIEEGGIHMVTIRVSRAKAL